MSFHKTAQVFPVINQEKIAQFISKTLRDEYGGLGSARKIIAGKTGVNPRTVKNWYEANNTPSLEHFLILARRSPMIASWFLKHSGYDALAEVLLNQEKSYNPNIYCLNFETRNPNAMLKKLQKLKFRQFWFYTKLKEREMLKSQDLVLVFGIGRATAYRDVENIGIYSTITPQMHLLCGVFSFSQ